MYTEKLTVIDSAAAIETISNPTRGAGRVILEKRSIETVYKPLDIFLDKS